MNIHLLITIAAFAVIWLGSGLAVSSVEKISRSLRISTFAVSFLVLGLFTSMSEFSVGINSIIENDPEIFVGNLLGASIVLFLLLIPLLAIFGKSITISPEFRGFNLPATLVVVGLPSLLLLDGVMGQIDAMIIVAMFLLLVFSIQAKKSILERIRGFSPNSKVGMGKELIKTIFGVILIFTASRYIVSQTLYYAEVFNVSPFLISLVAISLGTNIPELSIIIRSLLGRTKQLAFGDYLGSAAFNTFLLGVLTLVYGREIILTNSFGISLGFLFLGTFCFFLFAKSKNTVSAKEAFVLLSLYLTFLTFEYLKH